MRLFLLILFLSADSLVLAAEHPEGYVELIDLPITVRVDTTDADVKAVYDLLRNFLSTRLDSLYDNPYWNDQEKKHYPEPYPARRIIFQNEDILHAFPPLVLSIEKEGEYYCTRTLFYREGLEEPYKTSNPWAIQKLYAKKVELKKKKDKKDKKADSTSVADAETPSAVKDSTKKDTREYRLFDPLHVITKNWRHKRVGPIDYYYPLDYYFDISSANKMAQFCRGMCGKYGVPEVEPIEFYITRNVDEMASIVGLDFILGTSSGRSHAANGQVFSARGNEWYPHEVMHILLRDFKPHYILMEGIATYEGGSMHKSFDSLVHELAEYFQHNDTITFQNILDSPYLEGGTTIFYSVGAVLCKMADQKGGAAAIKELLGASTDNDHLYQKIETVLGIKREDLTVALRAKVKEYAGR